MKFFKKCTAFLLAATCLSAFAAGCSQGNKDDSSDTNSKAESGIVIKRESEYFKVFPGELKDDYVICAGKADLEIIEDIDEAADEDVLSDSSYNFSIISAEPLDDSDIKVEIDTNVPYTVSFWESVESKEKFEQDLCLQYNKFDGNNNDERTEKRINAEYEMLTDDQFPHYYTKLCTVAFGREGSAKEENEAESLYIPAECFISEESINEMKVSVKGKAYDVNIGEIKFETNTEPGDDGENALSFESDSYGRTNLYTIDNGGIISLTKYQADIKNDIIIKDIKLLNKSETLSLDEVSIGEDYLDIREWKKGEDLELSKDSQVYFNFTFKDTAFEKIHDGILKVYLAIEYESGGKTYTANEVLDFQCNIADPHMLYAIYNDNIDLESYYDR